jgi:hypothetical protein
MLDYEKSYSGMGDDELLRLASQWQTLMEPAQAALEVELEKRKLRTEFESTRRTALENAATSKTSAGKPPTVERAMFWLFICSGICALLMPNAYPFIFGVSRPRLEALYEIVEGVCDCFLVWLIIWLVLRAKRIRGEIQN